MTTYEEIVKLRQVLKEKLINYQGNKKIKLDIPEKLLEQIIFVNDIYKNKILALDFDLIKKLDLTNVSFDGVCIANLDFSNSLGVKINPQTVYQKDLQYTVLNGVTFTGVFDGSKIVGANFKGSINTLINPQTIYLKNFMNTTLCDVKFIGPFDDAFILKANFTGSRGAIINLEKLFEKDLCGTNLTDTLITSPLEDIYYDRNTVFVKSIKIY